MARRSQRQTSSVGQSGEFGFLAELLPRLRTGRDVVVGPGQDCAVVRIGPRRLLVTVDALVEGVHFRKNWMSSAQLGRRSILVNASDIAAMGGRPRWCLVSLVAPRSSSRRTLDAIHRGIDDAAAEIGACVIGGNVAAGRDLGISVTLIGDAPKRIITRRGARPGDRIFVTGTLGDAARGVRCLRRGLTTGHAVRRYREPIPRLAAGRLLVESGAVSAMIDVSDGLVQDLGHICRESGVGARVDAGQIPVSETYRRLSRSDMSLALAGGEDYELLCTVPPRRQALLDRLRSRLDCSITAIGRITSSGLPEVVDAKGRPVDLSTQGYDHFARG